MIIPLIIQEQQLLRTASFASCTSELKKRTDKRKPCITDVCKPFGPSVHAAFIDIGQELNAFLPLEDGQKLKGGDMMIVQGVAKQTTQSKGLRISTQINLTGQWLVLIPGETGVHISKKVKDTALRAELAEIGKQICPEGCSIIIRTASENVKLELLREEANELYQKWLDANQKAKGMVRPGVLVGPTPLYLRLVRDLAGSLSKIAVNDEGCFLALKQAQREGKIAAETELLYFKESDSLIFDSFNLETQIDKALKKRVWLPCGGYLIIDFTEALTVIDVNSGKMVKGKSVEETALCVNMEAVSEIARQLRLRDVGGIIVIDLIDMQKDSNRHAVLDALKKALKKDRMPTSVDGITKLGLLEMTRRRKSEQLRRTLRTNMQRLLRSGRNSGSRRGGEKGIAASTQNGDCGSGWSFSCKTVARSREDSQHNAAA